MEVGNYNMNTLPKHPKMKFLIDLFNVEDLKIYLINGLALTISLSNIEQMFSILALASSFCYTMFKILQMVEAKGRSYKAIKRAKKIKKSKKK